MTSSIGPRNKMDSRPTAVTWSSDSTLVSTSSNDSAPGTPGKDQVLAFTTQDPAWKEAWEKFELTLTDEQRDTVLIKGASLQEVLETAELLTQRQRKGKRYSISQIIKPFLDGLKRFEGVFNVYAQISPMILGSLWGSVKIVLLLANGFVDTFELLSGVLAKAGEKLRKVERLADLFPEAKTMKSILYDIYAKIIEIIATVIAFFNRKGIKSLWRSFWGDVERKLNSLVDCLVDRTADADQEALLSFFKKSNEEVAENRLFREAFNEKLNLFTDTSERSALIQAEQRAQVLKWLDAPNHTLTKEKVQRQRTAGTGDWLLQKKEFQEFCAAQSKSVVWVHGSIGSGKSTLASHAVDVMQQSLQDDEALFYYFCSFQEPSASEMNAVLRSFIVQALERKPTLLPHIFATTAASGESFLRSPGRILSLLTELVEPFGAVRIVIDGLDECPDAAELVNAVLTLIGSDTLNLNLLVFSREDSALHRALDSHRAVAITPGDTLNDMTKYLEESLGDMEHLFETDEDSKEVKDTILCRANGVFLWVRLVVDSLQNASFPEEVDQLLNDLPVGLDSALTRFFDRLLAPGAPQAKLVAQTLEYLVVSQRALTLDEICGLLSLRPETKHIARGRNTDRLSQIIHRLLGPVIRITKSSNSVELVHLSIKEFLTRHKRSPISLARASENMAFGCLACLKNSQLDASCLTTGNVAPLLEKDSLLSYALVYWGSHFNTCNNPSTHTMNVLKQFLASPEKVTFWLRVMMTAKSESTGEAVTNDLLLLESHMRAVARAREVELPEPVVNGNWLTELFQLILNRFVSEFGENDLRTLQWYAALGKLNIKYDLCEGYLKRAIEGFKIHKARGAEHPETVTTMVALGRIYWNMSRLTEAEEVLQQCCDFREAELGKDDPDTLEAFSWVATIHRGQGHHAQACEEYEYVIKVLQRLYGRQNRVVMRELRMLGVARRHEGSYDTAEALFKECLAWSSDTLGEKHPETVQAAKNLAVVYQMQGRLAEAEQIHRDVIAKQLDVTGEDAEYFISLSNLGGTLLDQNKVEEAETVLWKALRGKDQWHGVDHPNTKNTLECLGRLYEKNTDFGSEADRSLILARLGAGRN